MKKILLLSWLMTMLGVLSLSATRVVINVDNASNVSVVCNYGYGKQLELTDGINSLELSDSDDSPLKITATPGATIKSVTLNESEVLDGNAGEYLVRFYNTGIKLDIVTSGQGSTPTVRDVSIQGFYAMGEGISGTPFAVTYDKDGQWLDAPYDTWGFYSIPEGSTVKVTPVAPYSIDSLTLRNGTFESTALADGSYTFICDYDTFYYQAIYVNMSVSGDAIRFSITADYAANITAALESQREGEWKWLTLRDGKNDFVCMASESPLEFFAAEGAEIISMTRNGEPTKPTGWNGANGWVYELEDGDEFVVSTRGREVTINLTVPEGNPSLENYVYAASDGRKLSPEGMQYALQAYDGEIISVTPRPGTQLSYLVCQNGGQTDMLTYFRVAGGADGVNPMQVSIYGSKISSDVTIVADDASRFQVVQEGGRGDILPLQNGSNTFSPSDIRNALAISATEGNQMVSVTKNGQLLSPNAGGVYSVVAEATDWIEVVSRKQPVDVSVSFAFAGDGALSWIKGKIDGQEAELTSPMTMKSYSTLTLTAQSGYTLQNVAASPESVLVEALPENQGYAVTVPTADITSVNLTVSAKELEAEEGYAIVSPNGEEIFILYYEYKLSEDGEMVFVKKLQNNVVTQIKLGHYVRAYCKDTQSRFLYVRANGEDVPVEPDSEGRIAFIRIDGRTVIEAEIHTPCLAYTQASNDEVKHIVSGTIYFDIDGELLTSVYPEAGQTVKFVPVPEKGYLFDHMEMFYSNTIDSEGIVVENNEYTFTASDLRENFILFMGVFYENPDEKTYVVRGSTAWLIDADGNVVTDQSSAVGNVVFQTSEGGLTREMTGIEGDKIQMFVEVDEDVRDQYEVASYCFMNGFPDNKIPGSVYTIDPKDADSEGVIWINALVGKKGNNSVAEVSGGASLGYDAASGTITSTSPVRVYTLSGTLVLSSDGHAVAIDNLPSGVYLIVNDDTTLKICR
ncbi:MAG: hypothetical protein K1V75_03475 [Muribaculaceae bacterium]